MVFQEIGSPAVGGSQRVSSWLSNQLHTRVTVQMTAAAGRPIVKIERAATSKNRRVVMKERRGDWYLEKIGGAPAHSPHLLHIEAIAPSVVDLRLREVHLRVGRLELLEEVVLLLLIRRWETHCLLALVVHHLLDGLSRLAIEVTQLGVFGDDLTRVDLRVALHHRIPPLHAVEFLHGDLHGLPIEKRPHRIVRLHLAVHGPLQDGRLALDPDRERRNADVTGDLLRFGAGLDGNEHFQVAKRLSPRVLVRRSAVPLRRRRAVVLIVILLLLLLFGLLFGHLLFLLPRLFGLDGLRLLVGDFLYLHFGLCLLPQLGLALLPLFFVFRLLLLATLHALRIGGSGTGFALVALLRSHFPVLLERSRDQLLR